MKENFNNDLRSNIYIIIKKKEINNGVQILRMILSYLVLQSHCYNVNLTKNKIIIGSYRASSFCVPTFFVISYFFSNNILKLKNINKIKYRLERIIIPYIIWPIFFFIINHNFFKKKNLKKIFIQLITGKGINNVFWFQCNLIFSFIFFSILVLLLRNKYLFTIQLIGIAGYIYSYLHFYNNFFRNCIIEVESLIQDFFQILFFASIGISISSIECINYLKINKRKAILFSLFILYLIRDFLKLFEIFYYLKTIILGIGAVSLFILFSIIPLNFNKNKILNKIIIQITNYTGGVYYLHTTIKDRFKKKLNIIKNRTLSGCVINYIICYIICFLGFKLFKKTNLKYLFI